MSYYTNNYHFPVGSEEDMCSLIRMAGLFINGPGINFSDLPEYKRKIYIEFHSILNKYKTDTFNRDAKCECGSEKLGYTEHSNWCEKYNG